MNQELFDSMRKQMTPSPRVRAALSEKLARPAKKRPVPWKKYAAACAALVIGGLSAYGLCQDHGLWRDTVRSFQRDSILIGAAGPLHSYVTADGLAGYVQENAATTETGNGDTGAPNTGALPAPNAGDLPGGACIGDAPSQEEAGAAYQKLMDRFDGTYPDWYGGAYIDSSGWLAVRLVEDKDPADKSLELQVLDWTDSGQVMFSSCKYSLAGLNRLMDQFNAFLKSCPECAGVMAGWGIDEEHNRIELTLTQVNDHILSALAQLDPDDDAIYVRVGQQPGAEAPAVYHVMPGGAAAPEDGEDLIADEPVYDGAHYDVENLPQELPQDKRPAFVETDCVPEEDADPERPVHGGTGAPPPAYDPEVGLTYPEA